MPENGSYCLWRHDVDFSIERALIMAEYESGYGIKANYFIQLSSNFYNVFDTDIFERFSHRFYFLQYGDAETIAEIIGKMLSSYGSSIPSP